MKEPSITMRVIATPTNALYPRGLMPCDEESYQAIGALQRDEEVQIRIVRERSNPQLRLFWTVLDHVARNTDWEDSERLLIALKVRLGRYDLCQLPNGKTVPVPHSISFDKMPQEQFQTFMERALDVICADVLGGYDKDQLVREAQGYAEAPR
jgi:hypothetical protein